MGFIALWFYMEWGSALIMEFCASKKYLCFIRNKFHAFYAVWYYCLFVLLEFYYFLEPNRWCTFETNSVVYGGFSSCERRDSLDLLFSSCFRQEVDGTYILELHKDEKKGEAKATIVMDFCTEVVRVSSDLWFCSNTACVLLDSCHDYIL